MTKLIRRNLELTDCLAVSLADELEFVDTYVGLEKESLGKDFDYQLDLDCKIDLKVVKVPSMLLQIPVENAIKHGLRLKEGKRLLPYRYVCCLIIRLKLWCLIMVEVIVR